MKSAVATTYELDDVTQAAHQLADAIREQMALGTNSVGLLFCDADTDGAKLSSACKELLGCEVAGLTTLATLDPDGQHESAAVLTLLSAEDCCFTVSASGSLLSDTPNSAIEAAYRQMLPPTQGCGEKPGLLFAFCPYGMSFSGDTYTETLSQVATDVPVMGGVASDDYDYERARVFLSGREYRDAMVLVGVWGHVLPHFSIRHVTSRFAEHIRRVTDASGNVVNTVGDVPFVEYLKSFGLDTDVPDPLLAFTSYPMMLTGDNDDEVPLMRHILSLDKATGAGTFFGDVPVGTLANICLISKDDVMNACRDSMQALLRQAQDQPDYEYSTILCISCCGRAMIMGADSDAEGRILSEMLPDGLTLTGAYCLGEICPTFYKNGKSVNRFHNCSITLCMF